MSDSLTGKVTMDSAGRHGHLLPMYTVWQCHLRADGLTPDISIGPNARSPVWANLYLRPTITSINAYDGCELYTNRVALNKQYTNYA